MAFCFFYLRFGRCWGALVGSRRGLDVRDIELLVLRHELQILRRHVARPRLTMVDRALLAAAAYHLPRSARASRLVTPRTLLRWHRAMVLGGSFSGTERAMPLDVRLCAFLCLTV